MFFENEYYYIHFRDLPRPANLPNQRLNLYYTTDVYNKALKVHGSVGEIYAQRRRLLGISNRLSDAEKMRLRMQLEARANTTAGADRVVFIALACNAIDTFCKFGAAYLTGSKSLFAEAIHSTMDTVNQMILYLGALSFYFYNWFVQFYFFFDIYLKLVIVK